MSRYFKYISLFSIAILLYSCKKELNVLPTTAIVDGNLITDSTSARTALNGVYYRFANGGVDGNNVPVSKWCDIMEILPSELAGTVASSGGDDNIFSYVFNSTSFPFQNLWTYNSSIVNAANGFLKNINSVSSVTATAKKQMIAEAKFLRAFANAAQLLSFGQYNDTTSKYGIIIRNEFVNTNTLTLPRSTVAESYASILQDLDESIEGLPAKNSSIIYANKTAAKILKARVLINRGSSVDLSNVISLVDDIISSTPFSLESSSKDIFLKNGLSSNEVVLGIQPYDNQYYKFYYYQDNGRYSANKNYTTIFNNDPRLNWYFKDDQESTVIGGYIGGIMELTKYYNGPIPGAQKTTNSEISYAFRLSEAYLYKAEALASLQQNMATAKSILSTILTNAGFTDLSWVDNIQDYSTLRFEVLKEECKNFMLENAIDWYAMRRMTKDQRAIMQPNLKTDVMLIGPIPNAEITSNKNMIQNPGYSN